MAMFGRMYIDKRLEVGGGICSGLNILVLDHGVNVTYEESRRRGRVDNNGIQRSLRLVGNDLFSIPPER